MGSGFPCAYFQQISIGTFTKALGFADLLPNHLVLLGFCAVYLLLSLALLKSQDA